MMSNIDRCMAEKAEERAVYVIAEVGSNHGGDLDTALQFVEASAIAGADAVKFQSWTTPLLQNALDPASGKPSPAIPVLQRYEVPAAWHQPLRQRCEQNGIDFLSTPFDLGKARLLRDVGVPAVKIASGDLTYRPLLNEVGGYGLPILLSTGMAGLGEIEQALVDLGPGRERTILLHCVGAYPPQVEDANLRAITTLACAFGLPVGFSDHYPGHELAIAAVALGARVIEKHVTFSRQAGHPDSPFAMELDELAEMVAQIRVLEKALGSGLKACGESERGGLVGGRRGLYWVEDLPAGTLVTDAHVALLRPNSGNLQPADLPAVVGGRLREPVCAAHPVEWRHLARG